jgi:hypothetical protein
LLFAKALVRQIYFKKKISQEKMNVNCEDDKKKTFLPPCIYKNKMKWMSLTVMNCAEMIHTKGK